MTVAPKALPLNAVHEEEASTRRPGDTHAQTTCMKSGLATAAQVVCWTRQAGVGEDGTLSVELFLSGLFLSALLVYLPSVGNREMCLGICTLNRHGETHDGVRAVSPIAGH